MPLCLNPPLVTKSESIACYTNIGVSATIQLAQTSLKRSTLTRQLDLAGDSFVTIKAMKHLPCFMRGLSPGGFIRVTNKFKELSSLLFLFVGLFNQL